MFEMFTDPKHFSQWLAPTGFDMKYIRAEIKPGGDSFYCMTGANGMKMYGKATYQEVTKPNRIVYTQYFGDEKKLNGTVIAFLLRKLSRGKLWNQGQFQLQAKKISPVQKPK